MFKIENVDKIKNWFKMAKHAKLTKVEKYYNKVNACVFSDDNSYVAAGDEFGRIVVFRLNYEDDLNTSTIKRVVHPGGNADDVHINTLATNDDMLYCGTSAGSLHVYRWSELISDKIDDKSLSSSVDVNLITGHICSVVATSDDDHVLVAGAGDNFARFVNVETSQITTKLTGHTKYIHAACVPTDDSNTVYTASEDGTVRVWDVRSATCTRKLVPSQTTAARPALGDWIGCLAVSSNWLVCGGGPALSLWNVTTQTHATTLPHDLTTVYHDVHMAKHAIMASGGRQRLAHFNYAGVALGVTETQVDRAICIAGTHQTDDDSLVAVSGYGNTVDIVDSPLARAASLAMP